MTIRLLDPPLHEFLPPLEEAVHDFERARIEQTPDLDELEKTLKAINTLQETNPMLGTRGCRLAILHPEICEMQVAAIVRAALAVRERTGHAPHAGDHGAAGGLREGAGVHARPDRARRSRATRAGTWS